MEYRVKVEDKLVGIFQDPVAARRHMIKIAYQFAKSEDDTVVDQPNYDHEDWAGIEGHYSIWFPCLWDGEEDIFCLDGFIESDYTKVV